MRLFFLGTFGLLLIAATPAVSVVRDQGYIADGRRAHQLDLYLPEQAAHAPLIVFVHGGAFIDGDRAWYRVVGTNLARQGFATAVVSYRLFPDADAYGSVLDVADAIAWLVKHGASENVDTSRVFLTGHSAGGQIVAVLAAEPSLLTDRGVPREALCGALPDAGAYDVRDLSGEPDWMQKADEKIFGATPELRSRVSAQLFVGPSSLPMLVACGTEDDPDACGRATRFVRALNGAGGQGALIREQGANHMAMLRGLYDSDDPLNKIMRQFVADHCRVSD